MQIVLNGLAGLTAEEEFTHEVIVPPEAKLLLEPGVLTITSLDTKISKPEQPLLYNVCFKPSSIMSTNVEFVVHKSSGGRWRFDVHLQVRRVQKCGV